MRDPLNPAAGLRGALVLVAAIAGVLASRAGASEPPPPSAATPHAAVTAAEIAPAAAAAPEPVVTRRAGGVMSVRPGERFVEYVVAGRDSSGRLRLRCVRGVDRVNHLLRNPAPWQRPRATR